MIRRLRQVQQVADWLMFSRKLENLGIAVVTEALLITHQAWIDRPNMPSKALSGAAPESSEVARASDAVLPEARGNQKIVKEATQYWLCDRLRSLL